MPDPLTNTNESPDEGPQQMYMWAGYEPLIRDGSKRQTIRVNDPFRPGPAQIVFEKDSGKSHTINARITGVTSARRADLTEEHAQRDGFGSLDELHRALDRHYPGLRMDAIVDVVTFELPG